MDNAKIIAVDFDGTLVENKWPEIGAPIEKNIAKVKAEQEAGAKIILWTNRVGEPLEKALSFCKEQGIHLDAVNENLPEITKAFGTDCRKIFANEYWDDRAVPMSEKDIGEFSDGFHTFNSLYYQRLILFAALVNTFPTLAWKSHKHSDGEAPFGGGWFIVGVDTPKGPYTYHYEDKDWDLFHCKEVATAPEWDGHTDKDVERVLSLSDDKSDWAAREVALASKKERESAEDKDDWDYGVACYESALRAYRSLERDGHSGMSIQITKSILNRLIDGKCLTPIEDDPDIWTKVEFGENDPIQHFQCKRMSSLFKDVAEDGAVTYLSINMRDKYTGSWTMTILDGESGISTSPGAVINAQLYHLKAMKKSGLGDASCQNLINNVSDEEVIFSPGWAGTFWDQTTQAFKITEEDVGNERKKVEIIYGWNGDVYNYRVTNNQSWYEPATQTLHIEYDGVYDWGNYSVRRNFTNPVFN